MKTISAKKEEVIRDWYLVDAKNKTLGRLSTEIAIRLRGKHKPIYTPHVDTGDFIVVINASKITVTGNKMQDKMYYKHTGYIGNLKSANLATMMKKNPETVLMKSVRGMLPKTKLGNAMIKKLRVFSGPEHTHTAQSPKPLEI
jgi:large subunit ribosomal protein L13